MSKKVKIVVVVNSYDNYGDDYNSIVQEGITDWEEISDDDYVFLTKNDHFLHKLIEKSHPNGTPKVLVQDDAPVKLRIDSIKEIIEQEKRSREEAQAKREKTKADNAKKRALKNATSELELLAELKRKYENVGDTK